jgi:hypothetical protein
VADHADDQDPTDTSGDETGPELSGTVVRRETPRSGAVVRRPAQALAAAWSRIPELARHPVVVATASVGAGLAVGAARQAIAGGASARRPAPAPPAVTAYVVHHVHVFHHHVVHHVPGLPLPPTTFRVP